MIDNSAAWIKRAEELLQIPATSGGFGASSESVQFAASMLTAFYGSESTQLTQFQSGCAGLQKTAENAARFEFLVYQHARGVIRNTVAELKAGLIVRLRIAVAGETLTEFIRLAREILEEKTDEAKNTAAVLSAAAYEGLIRKMGEEFAGVTDRPKLEDVIGKLKTTDIFKGGQVGTALSFLKFRNDSLHADWKNVDLSQVESCLTFSETLLVKHFAP